MARGPRGERRPEDPAQAAVLAVRIALGDVEEKLEAPATMKDPAAVALGRRGGLKGGVARRASLSEDERKRIAKKAAAVRWGRDTSKA